LLSEWERAVKRASIISSALVLFLTQATAQEWQQFGIKKFDFIFDVPPTYELIREYEGGGGAAFVSPEGDLLAIWGIKVEPHDFRVAIEDQISGDEREGWEFTYERVEYDWAAYSGVKDDMIRYVKAITVCDDRAAFFLMEYHRDLKVDYDPIVTRMEKSMQSKC
jgi:hypothetical protein